MLENTAPNSAALDRTALDGTASNSTVLSGAASNGAAPNSTVLSGAASNGTASNGTVLSGAASNAPGLDDAPGLDGLAVHQRPQPDDDGITLIHRPETPVPFRVVVVSSADISRGPAVQRILKTRLRSLGVEAALVLSSAGTTAAGGEPIHPLTARALSELGTDPHGHQAHRLTERRLVQADLILAVSREERTRVVALRPGVRGRTFTVVEFARLTAAAAESAERDPRRLVVELAGLRDSVRPVEPDEDDLEDPTPGTYRDHERVLRRVDHAVRDIARGLSTRLPSISENAD